MAAEQRKIKTGVLGVGSLGQWHARIYSEMPDAELVGVFDADYRACPPKEIAGSPLAKVIDYNKPEETGLPKSNVLQFFNEAGDVVSVRPSGTEPKIKFYFGARGDDAPAKIEQLKAQFIS